MFWASNVQSLSLRPPLGDICSTFILLNIWMIFRINNLEVMSFYSFQGTTRMIIWQYIKHFVFIYYKFFEAPQTPCMDQAKFSLTQCRFGQPFYRSDQAQMHLAIHFGRKRMVQLWRWVLVSPFWESLFSSFLCSGAILSLRIVHFGLQNSGNDLAFLQRCTSVLVGKGL